MRIMKRGKVWAALACALLLALGLGTAALAATEGTQELTTEVPCTVVLHVGAHGKATVDGTDYTGDGSFQRPLGTVVTYAFAPDKGYEVEKVIYNGADVTGGLSGNSYTAPALGGDAELTVTFRAVPSTPGGTPGGTPSGPGGIPRTGDEASPALWLALAGGGLALLGARHRKHDPRPEQEDR